MDDKDLGELLALIPDDDPRMLELLATTLIAYVERLEQRPPWADGFRETLEALASSPQALELWPLFLTRTYQMLARTKPWSAEELGLADEHGRLLPHSRVLVFARLASGEPDWELIETLDLAALDPISRAIYRLRGDVAAPETLRSQHRRTLERVRERPLGFPQLVLEEARTTPENPIPRLLELLLLGTMVEDPILDHEHPPEAVAALRARWHLYTAHAYLGSEQKNMLAEHMLRYQSLARDAQHDRELVASGFELLAAEKARQGQVWDARQQIDRALEHLGDAGPRGRSQELRDLAEAYDSRAREVEAQESPWLDRAPRGRPTPPS